MASKRPLLGPVKLDCVSLTGDPQFVQAVEEITISNGRQLIPGDLWIDGTLRADCLRIAWAERMADIPQFIAQVQQQTGSVVAVVMGVPSVAAAGEPPLLGDWIASGAFDEKRFALTMARELGGEWEICASQFQVEFRRLPGT